MNTHEAVTLFLAAQVGDVSESTRVWYGRCLSSFADFVGPVPLADVTRDTIRGYRAHLSGRGLSPHSIHGYQRALRRLFAWLVKEGLIEQDVTREVPLVRLPPQVPKALAEADLDRLLARLPQESIRDRAIILFLIDTGCRVGGLCGLTRQALDIPNGCAVVVEKGCRSRRVYFTEVTAEALRLHLSVRPENGTDALFVSAKGHALTPSGVRLMLERVGERAGVVGRINAHSFRHAFARAFLRNGGNLAALGRLLGHSPGSPVTAKYYAVWDDRELQEFHERYSPMTTRRTIDFGQSLRGEKDS